MLARPRAIQILCGCFAWRLGSAQGSVLCGFHVQTHTRGEDWRGDDACDCLRCRARRRGLGAYAIVEELWDQDRASHAPRETVEVPTTKGPAPDLRESGRKCECVWLCRGGEWRIEYPCEGHAKEPKKKRDARQRERNEHGWA